MAFLDDYNYSVSGSSTKVRIRVKDTTKTSYADIPETFTDNGVTYTVTRLYWTEEPGNSGVVVGCFENCVNLKTIPAIPSSVTDMDHCFLGCSSLTSLPNNFTIPSGVTYLRKCFSGCSSLTSLPNNFTIPSGVTNMSSCFYDCSSLTSLPNNFTIPDGVGSMYECFEGCQSLKSLPNNFTIPSSVYDVRWCFYHCSSLTSLPSNFTIPSGVTDLTGCFGSCSSLTSLPSNFTVPSGVTDMSSCFSSCSSLTSLPSNFTIPSGVTDMSGCFASCSSLTSLPSNFTIPSGVTDMFNCFNNCRSLTSLPSNFTIPSGVTSMSSCFYRCSSLTSLPNNFTIPSGVTNMNYCFGSCSSLTSLPSNFTIPSGVTNMEGCFSSCSSLTSLPSNFTIPSGVTDMSSCFYNCSSLTSLPSNFTIPFGVTDMSSCFRSCLSLTSLPSNFTIPSGVRNMSQCFDVCRSLTSLPNNFTIPSGVTNMNYCFASCSSLTSLPSNFTIPSGVTSMDYCFRSCSSLMTLPNIFTIPASVTTMAYCFYGCSNLESVPKMLEGVISMAYGFYGCSKIKKSPTIPSTVTLMNGCFSMCTSLEEPPVSLPSGLVDMDRCFYNTKITESPEIPNTVTDMELCFYLCNKLGSAPKIPASVKNLKSCFKYCYSLGGYLLFEANPDSYDDMFYGTSEEIRLVTPVTASNYNKAVLIASKYVNVQVDSNFSLFPPPVITEFVCKRVGSEGLEVERRQGDWVYYRVRFKNFTEFLPGDLQVPTPPIPEVRMYADGKLVYNDWINKETDPNAVNDDSEVEATGAGGWDQFTAGGGSGDKPNYYEQEIVGWIKFQDSQAAHNIGFLIEGYYNKVSDLIYKTVTSTFKVLDIAAPSLNENDEYDVYSKKTFAMGIGTLASRQGGLSIGVPTTFEHVEDDDPDSEDDRPAISVLGKMEVNEDFIIGNGSSATFRAITPSRPDGIFMQVGGSEKSAGNADGTALRIGAGGLTLIGGGDYAYTRYDLGDLDDNSENLYLGSDNAIYFETNADTIGNRNQSWINTSGNFVIQSPTVRGSSPSSNTYRSVDFVDATNKRLALVENGVLTEAGGDHNRLNLYVLGHHTTSDQYSGIVIYKTKGNTGSVNLLYNANNGDLTVPGNVYMTDRDITTKDTNIERDKTESSGIDTQGYYFKDKNDVWTSRIINRHNSTANSLLIEKWRVVDGSNVYNNLYLGVKADGTKYVGLDATAWKTALSLTNASNWRSIASVNANGYWGMGITSSDTSAWIRTSSSGLIPYSSNNSTGASALGTSSWPFSNVYAINSYVLGSSAGSFTNLRNAVIGIGKIGTQLIVAKADGTSETVPGFTDSNSANIREHLVTNTSGVQEDVSNYSYSPTWTHTSGYTVWGGVAGVNSNHNTACYISRIGSVSKVVSTSGSKMAELTVTISEKELGVYT